MQRLLDFGVGPQGKLLYFVAGGASLFYSQVEPSPWCWVTTHLALELQAQGAGLPSQGRCWWQKDLPTRGLIRSTLVYFLCCRSFEGHRCQPPNGSSLLGCLVNTACYSSTGFTLLILQCWEGEVWVLNWVMVGEMWLHLSAYGVPCSSLLYFSFAAEPARV